MKKLLGYRVRLKYSTTGLWGPYYNVFGRAVLDKQPLMNRAFAICILREQDPKDSDRRRLIAVYRKS